MINNAKARKLLIRYARGEKEKLSEEEYVEMIQLLSIHCPALKELICEEELDSNSMAHQSAFKELYQCLASPSPVCATMAHTGVMGDILKDLVNDVNLRTDPVKWQLLQESSPVIFRLFANDTGLMPLSKTLKQLFQVMYDNAKAPFEVSQVTEEDVLATDEVVDDQLACFPSLPQLRDRGVFEADLLQKKQTKCNKEFRGHPSLLPGIFTVFCEHGKYMISPISSLLKQTNKQ